MMKRVLTGKNMKDDIKKRVQDKLNPRRIMNSSVFNIGKLVSMNGDMGRMLKNFSKVKNSSDAMELVRNLKNAGDSGTNLIKRLTDELKRLQV